MSLFATGLLDSDISGQATPTTGQGAGYKTDAQLVPTSVKLQYIVNITSKCLGRLCMHSRRKTRETLERDATQQTSKAFTQQRSSSVGILL